MAGKKKKQTLAPVVVAALAELTGNDALLDLARESVDHATDQRFVELSAKEAYFRGDQYHERPYDWSGNLVNPKGLAVMRERHGYVPSHDETPATNMRRPSTTYNLGKVVVSRFGAMLVGKKRFPTAAVAKDHDTQLWCNRVMSKAKFQAHFSEAVNLGGMMGSVLVMFKVVDGRFQLECFNTKFCTVVWKSFTEGSMHAFSVSYPYQKQVLDEKTQRWETKTYAYRRVVTENFDIEFEPQELIASMGKYRLKDGEGAVPVPNPDRTVQHNLGRCPGRFIQNLPRYDQVDGDCDYEGLQSKIDRINENLSAINSAIQSNLDPTLVLKMTPDDYKRLEETGGPIKMGNDGFAIIVGDKGDAKYIEVQCANIEVAIKIMELMRVWALEEADCVVADPHKISGAAQSDSAISKLYTPMLAKLDLKRTQYGDRGIKELLGDMIHAHNKLTAVVVTEDGPTRPYLKPIEVVDPATLKSRAVVPNHDIESDDIELTWGRYFEPSANDVFQVVEAAVMATGGKAVTTQKQAAHFVADYFGDPAVETTIVALEAQAVVDAELAAKAAEPAPSAPARPSKETGAKVKP